MELFDVVLHTQEKRLKKQREEEKKKIKEDEKKRKKEEKIRKEEEKEKIKEEEKKKKEEEKKRKEEQIKKEEKERKIKEKNEEKKRLKKEKENQKRKEDRGYPPINKEDLKNKFIRLVATRESGENVLKKLIQLSHWRNKEKVKEEARKFSFEIIKKKISKRRSVIPSILEILGEKTVIDIARNKIKERITQSNGNLHGLKKTESLLKIVFNFDDVTIEELLNERIESFPEPEIPIEERQSYVEKIEKYEFVFTHHANDRLSGRHASINKETLIKRFHPYGVTLTDEFRGSGYFRRIIRYSKNIFITVGYKNLDKWDRNVDDIKNSDDDSDITIFHLIITVKPTNQYELKFFKNQMNLLNQIKPKITAIKKRPRKTTKDDSTKKK